MPRRVTVTTTTRTTTRRQQLPVAEVVRRLRRAGRTLEAMRLERHEEAAERAQAAADSSRARVEARQEASVQATSDADWLAAAKAVRQEQATIEAEIQASMRELSAHIATQAPPEPLDWGDELGGPE